MVNKVILSVWWDWRGIFFLICCFVSTKSSIRFLPCASWSSELINHEKTIRIFSHQNNAMLRTSLITRHKKRRRKWVNFITFSGSITEVDHGVYEPPKSFSSNLSSIKVQTIHKNLQLQNNHRISFQDDMR